MKVIGHIKSRWIAAGVIALAAVFLSPADSRAQSVPDGEVIDVKMVDNGGGQWRFEPAYIAAQPGDLVRFVQEDVVPHNVEFKQSPEGTDLGDARVGPLIFTKGEAYELAIDDRFASGEHEYVCTPHATMGMKGIIMVRDVP
ncbi:MAG: plastocyanin/azurin family copper-binding protein [Rhodothermales bacterium]